MALSQIYPYTYLFATTRYQSVRVYEYMYEL